MTRLVRFSNNAVSRLAANITNADTSISLTPGDGAKFPVISGSQFFMATLLKADGTIEIVKVTARSSDTLTVVRAAEQVGATQVAYAFTAGDRIEQRMTAKAMSDELDRLDSGANIGTANKTANYTVLAADVSTLIRVDTTAGAITVTLPQISSLTDDFDIMVAKVTGDANLLNVVRAGSTDLINGAASYVINNQWQSVWLISDRSTGTWTAINSGAGSTNVTVDSFTGSGTAGPFTLSGDPGSKNNTAVYVGGVYQQKATYTLSGTSLTLGGTVEAGVAVEVMWAKPNPIGVPSDGTVTTLKLADNAVTDAKVAADAGIQASKLAYMPAGTGAAPTTVQSKLRETVSVKDFGAVGDGSNEYTKIAAAWAHCLANGKDLYFPAGVYSSGVNNMPFKNTDYPATTLLDCKNITIFGDGPNTVLRSDSVDGADVLNLYSVKNLHVRNLKVTANLSGTTGAGSNGISIVGGFDNLTFDHIWFENLPYVDKASYLDGGKAFTIQPGTPATECGTVQGRNLYAKGCVYGVGLEVDLVNWGAKKHAIDVDIVAEDCHIGIIFSAGAATSALSSNMTMGYRVRGRLINCQRNVALGRAHGVDIEANIITTKAAASRRLNPSGGTWNSVDSVVDGLLAQYAKNSRLVVYGDLGECDYKAQIGGTTAGSSGQGGTTDNCQIYVDLGGSAASADINAINTGGNIVTNTVLYVSSTTTAGALPTTLYTASYNNTVTKGPAQRMVAPTIAGAVGFAYDDGITVYNTLERDGLGMFFKQVGGSSADLLGFGVKNHSGSKVFSVRNDGSFATGGRGDASAVATIKGVLPVYTEGNVFWGYVPVYTSYTP